MGEERGIYYMGKVDLDALAWADKDSRRCDIVMDAFIPVCRCGACIPHASDCAVHNGEWAAVCDCRTRLPHGRRPGRRRR